MALKLIRGGLYRPASINGIKIAISSLDSPPFPVDVTVFEEDTNLVLTVAPEYTYQEEHPIRLMTSIMESPRYTPGTVVRHSDRWYAVVIDLDREPVIEGKWCKEALDNIFQMVRQHRITSLAIPILGTVHGRLDVDEQLKMILEKLNTQKSLPLKSLWIVSSN
jgi:hypothetical protein